VANCTLDGPLVPLPQGGRGGTLRFDHELVDGERYYFAYTTRFNSDRPCRPTILYEVRGLRMDLLTVRAQFDPAGPIPTVAWFFDVVSQADAWHMPEPGSPNLRRVAANGYVEAEFRDCRHGRKYGLQWAWP
jgi:hypothetical protein